MQEKNKHFLTFRNRVENLQVKTGRTQEQVGKLMGLSRTMLHLIFTGKSRITNKTLIKLSKAEQEAGIMTNEQSSEYGIVNIPKGVPLDAKSDERFKTIRKEQADISIELGKLETCKRELEARYRKLSEEIVRIFKAAYPNENK